MVRTTRAQRLALKRVYDRGPIYPCLTKLEQQMADRGPLTAVPITYKQFRRGLQGTFGCDGAVTIQWAGMWLAIESDGYTHS
jgi:hypothetical protein